MKISLHSPPAVLWFLGIGLGAATRRPRYLPICVLNALCDCCQNRPEIQVCLPLRCRRSFAKAPA